MNRYWHSIIMFTALLAAGCVTTIRTPTPLPSPSTPAQLNQATPTPIAQIPATLPPAHMGETVIAANWQLTVLELEFHEEITAFAGPREPDSSSNILLAGTLRASEETQILELRASIENTEDEVATFVPEDVVLTYSDKGTSILAGFGGVGGDIRAYIHDWEKVLQIQVKPNTEQDVRLIFTAPQDASELVLNFLDLRPIAVSPSVAKASKQVQATVFPEAATPESALPRPGSWEGDHSSSFNLTNDGQLLNFKIKFKVGLSTCEITAEEITVELGGTFVFSTILDDQPMNRVRGTFENATQVRGTIGNRRLCEGTASMLMGDEEEQWSAEWKEP